MPRKFFNQPPPQKLPDKPPQAISSEGRIDAAEKEENKEEKVETIQEQVEDQKDDVEKEVEENVVNDDVNEDDVNEKSQDGNVLISF